MGNSLQEIAKDYVSAELTCLLVHSKKTGQHLSLITLIELLPVEQEDSPPIGTGSYPYNVRDSYDDTTFYVIRIPGLPIVDMLTLFEKADKGMALNHKGIKVVISVPYLLQPDPPDYQPIMIKAKDEKTIGKLLPRRNTHCRVWSKINIDKSWTDSFDQRFLSRVSRLSLTYLDHDITTTPEHFGNVYLFASNPVLRHWDSSLVDLQKDLLINFYEREGKTLAGGKIILEETRGGNKGFLIEHPVNHSVERVNLPYFPDILDITILDSQNRLIDHSHGAWVNMYIGMNIHHRTVNYTITDENNEQKSFSVAKTSSETGVSIEKFDRSVSRYLADALDERKHEELASNNEFIFFEKGPGSKEKAAAVVKWILNKATERCIILDPYFSVKDMLYVFQISSLSVPVQIISSAAFLSRKAAKDEKLSRWRKAWEYTKTMFSKKKAARKLIHAEVLARTIAGHRESFREQSIDCKVLKGHQSPLHDRYIVVNDEVYLLGSSLSEFGNRTTTVIKVPAPRKMIEKALAWWAENTECIGLDDYIKEKETEKKKNKPDQK